MAGVKGMKWGIRRARRSGGGRSKQPRAEQIRSMSSTELRERINRIKLENEYAQLTMPKWKKYGKKFIGTAVEAIMKEHINNVARNLANAGGLYVKAASPAVKDIAPKQKTQQQTPQPRPNKPQPMVNAPRQQVQRKPKRARVPKQKAQPTMNLPRPIPAPPQNIPRKYQPVVNPMNSPRTYVPTQAKPLDMYKPAHNTIELRPRPTTAKKVKREEAGRQFVGNKLKRR